MAIVRKAKEAPNWARVRRQGHRTHGKRCGELISSSLAFYAASYLPCPGLLLSVHSENLLDSLCHSLSITTTVRKDNLGSKRFGEGGPRPLHEDWRKEKGGESRPCGWNLLIFQVPGLLEGRGSILWAVPGSIIEMANSPAWIL